MSAAVKPAWPLALSQRALLARHLATCARAGLAPDSVRMISSLELGGRGLGRHAEWIASRLEAGESLSEAIASTTSSFTAEDAALVAAGERTGRLASALDTWASLIASRAEIFRHLLGAAIIPILTSLAVLVSGTLILWKVAPTFATLALEGEVEFAPATQWMLRLAYWVPAACVAALLVGLSLALAFLFPSIVPGALRRAGHRLLLHVPLAGRIRRRAGRLLALETLHAGSSAGLPPQESLLLAAAAEPNLALAAELERAAAALERGDALPPGRILDAATRHAVQRALARSDAPAALERLAVRERHAMQRTIRRVLAVAPGVATIAAGLLAFLLLSGTHSMMLLMTRIVQ